MFSRTKYSLCLAAILAGSSSAFVVPSNQPTSLSSTTTALSAKTTTDDRRGFLQQAILAGAAVMLPATPSHAGLLDEFGADPAKIVTKPTEVYKPPVTKPKGEAGIDPALKVCK